MECGVGMGMGWGEGEGGSILLPAALKASVDLVLVQKLPMTHTAAIQRVESTGAGAQSKLLVVLVLSTFVRGSDLGFFSGNS